MDDEIAAFIYRRDRRRAARQEHQRPRPVPKLKVHVATSLKDVGPPPDGLLGNLIASDVTVLLGAAGSKTFSFVLAIAEAIARGREIVGQRSEPKRVFYLDPVRPISAIKNSLKNDPARLSNLYIMAREDFGREQSVLNGASEQLRDLETFGLLPSLIIANPLDRLAAFEKFKEGKALYRSAGATEVFDRYPGIPKLVVVPVPSPKLAGLHSVRGKMPELIDGANSILILQAVGERQRLMHYLYGELVADLAVDPSNWKAIGNFDTAGKDSVRAKVLALLTEADSQGLSPLEATITLGLERNSIYQALFLLKKAEAVEVRGRYYIRGKAPDPDHRSTSSKGKK